MTIAEERVLRLYAGRHGSTCTGDVVLEAVTEAVRTGHSVGVAAPVRMLGLVLASVILSACGSDATETVPGGHVVQHVDYARYPVTQSTDVIVVVNTARTVPGTALREGVAKALREHAQELAEGDAPWLRDVWNPIDVRAFVANAADGARRSPGEEPSLAWREENATKQGAEAFGAAAAAALAVASTSDARKEGLIAKLHEELAGAATPPGSARIIVVVSSEDDASAAPAPDTTLRPDDSVIVVLPSVVDGAACAHVSAPHLEAWARANGGVVETPCSDIGLRTSFVDHASRCLPPTFRSATDGQTSCRVRAFVPPGTACDAARGWRSPAVALPPGARGDAPKGMSVCDVVVVEGEDARRCQDSASRYDGRTSGWCLPAPTPTCSARPPRLVGGAAPPWATMEVICNRGE